MASWVWTLILLSSSWPAGHGSRPWKLEFFRSKTELNHLVVDEVSGTVYLGAVNALYQLTADLQLVHAVETGPALDNKKCTPPIEPSQCQEAVDMDNVNKLLLLDRPAGRLVECGSLFKGICALRELGNISHRIFYEDSSGEKSFVASNDERVSTVGLVTSVGKDDGDGGPGERVLFVGKGNGPHDNGIIISTRLLDRKDGKEAFEAYTDHTAFKAGYLSANTQQFVAVFEDGDYVFFIFNQQDKQPAKNRTIVARMCKQDSFYYSYFEMDLECQGASGDVYSICHAAFVAPGPTPEASQVLFAVFSKDSKGSGGTPRSALCLFPLEKIHQKMEENRNKCYMGAQGSSSETFYKPFHGDIQCVSHGMASQSFRCGSEHLPYPLGSRDGLVGTATLQRDGMNLTAVTVTTENGHTVVLLGTSGGRIHKVFLRADGTSMEYGSILVEMNKRIERDLVFSTNGTNLYVMTQDKVLRFPVQECLSYTTCEQCKESRDPYCGWCVLEGRCTRKINCLRAEEKNHWLWSWGDSCVTVTSAQPQNMSRRAQGERLMRGLPTHQTFILSLSTDHVEVLIILTFLRTPVFLTSHMYPFYDCKEAMSLKENVP
uniref:Sema domain-containing protein n=1 Tax=Monodelphis domestica TaxID=13616 RepID=A0A5F8GTK3_MONDO